MISVFFYGKISAEEKIGNRHHPNPRQKLIIKIIQVKNMGTGLVVCFDEESANRLKELWRIFTDSPDLHGRIFEEAVPPHITLFGHEDDIRKQEFYDALESAISKYNSFSLNFTGLTTFPSTQVLYLNPEYSNNLHSLRKLCLETLEGQGVILGQDPDSTWNPHMTLLLDLPTQEISKAVEISQNYLDLQITKPFVVKISHIELFSYPPYIAEKKFFLHKTAE